MDSAPWRWNHRTEPGDTLEGQTEKVLMKARDVLYKLIYQSSDSLSEGLLKLDLEEHNARIVNVAEIVLEMAISDTMAVSACAKMVRDVCQNAEGETAKKFLKEVLDRCDQRFQEMSINKDKIRKKVREIAEASHYEKEALKLDLEDFCKEMRERDARNVRFMGEFFKLGMLNIQIMVGSIETLLGNQDEESYECLCTLLPTTGKRLESSLKDLERRAGIAKLLGGRMPEFVPEDDYMDKTFGKLVSHANDHTLSFRVRSALLDLVELRDRKWFPRPDSSAQKMDEVRRGINLTHLVGQRRQSTSQKKADSNTVPSATSSRLSQELSTVSISPTPIENYCDKDYSMRGQDDSIQEPPARVEIDGAAETGQVPESENNIAVDDEDEVEEGELPPGKEEDEEGDEHENEASNKPPIRTYDREFLLRIGRETTGLKSKVDIPIADLIKVGNGRRNPFVMSIGLSKRNTIPSAPASVNQSTRQKKGDWNTVPSAKSSRFSQVKKSSEISNRPVLPPTGVSWGGPPPFNRPSSNNSSLPPRLQQQQLQQQQQQQSRFSRFGSGSSGPGSGSGFGSGNRFNSLSTESSSSSFGINLMPGGGSMSTGGSSAHMIQSSQQQHQRSPPPPSTPTQQPPTPSAPRVNPADLQETVKNIFEEYLSVQNSEDTLYWIKDQFPDSHVLDFIDTLAREVAEMSKEHQHIGAGKLVKMLIKQKYVQRDQALDTIAKGVIPDIPDIQVDSPKVISYVAKFVLELFADEGSLDWLMELSQPLKEDFEETYVEFISTTLDLFKLKRNEQFVKSLWNNTKNKDSLLYESLPWLSDESRTSLVNKIIPVLEQNDPKEIVNIFKI